MRMPFSTITRSRLPRGIVAVVLTALALSSCGEPTSQRDTAGADKPKLAPLPADQSPSTTGLTVEQIRTLVGKWCGACHMPPDPGDLPRERWPYMIKWMGVYLGHPNSDEDIKNLIYPTLVPTQPSITREELDAIEAYYVDAAPVEIAPAFPRDQSLPITTLFRPEHWPGYDRPLTVSLVKIDAERRHLYLGPADPALVHLFSADGKLLNKVNCSQNQAVEVRPTDEGFDLVLMGNLEIDVGQGTAHKISVTGMRIGPLRAERIVEGFHRTSGAAWGDLDGDGNEDIVMAGFGDYADGALAWFAVKPGQESVRHDLRVGSGTLDAVIDDVDHDGDLDILSIVAQGHQEMWWFENDGKGNFQPHLLWKERPGMGYNAFQWIDFDGDGDKDIIAVAGNNMEMADPPLKSMHGVYVYVQTAPMQFTKTHFLRMDGATKALAGDYDGDGDLDIAAISAYPDWRADSPVVFVLFTNEGEGQFTPSTIPAAFSGQPITMDAGDLDSDGDLDIVLGGAKWAPLLPEPLLTKASEQIRTAPAVVLLRNQSAPSDR
ncbi:MAG: VCBS repeat-containing protein [Pirellulales bacterium]